MEGSSNYDIDSYINKNFETAWCFTGFYGEPKTTKHCGAWNDLRVLIHHSNTPWICAGRFKEITQQGEKLGGALQSHNQEQHFREVINECGFMDLGFIGQRFTWSKHF